ncbi:hypothetical protein B488_06050 [Liberibacter crescens BT-1]|uniref:Uncharacterized protein n=1 Tax=Liberibacter crescens (strain BT-1) TaxID=1215343 RepID=L0EUG5_LIBCB|nr:hypothetical protein [Liberibacter crescens]AGA64597.1 hypothetical protein B488_06050 [Liberibacter crescens BT-1]
MLITNSPKERIDIRHIAQLAHEAGILCAVVIPFIAYITALH